MPLWAKVWRKRDFFWFPDNWSCFREFRARWNGRKPSRLVLHNKVKLHMKYTKFQTPTARPSTPQRVLMKAPLFNKRTMIFWNLKLLIRWASCHWRYSHKKVSCRVSGGREGLGSSKRSNVYMSLSYNLFSHENVGSITVTLVPDFIWQSLVHFFPLSWASVFNFFFFLAPREDSNTYSCTYTDMQLK